MYGIQTIVILLFDVSTILQQLSDSVSIAVFTSQH